jgi:ribosomal protein S27AE
MSEAEKSRCPKCGEEIGEVNYCPSCGFHLAHHLDAIILSRLFGRVEIGKDNVHKLSQERLWKIGRELGFMAILEYEAPDLVKIGRRSFIDVVWKSKKGIVAAFEVKTKKQNLDIVTTRKDKTKLEHLAAQAKFIVNVSEITGKAYFHKIIDSSRTEPLPSQHPSIVTRSVSIVGREKMKSYSVEQIRKKYRRAYEKWTSEEDVELVKQYREGLDFSELAKLHQRQKGAIRSRLVKLGLIQEDTRKHENV